MTTSTPPNYNGSDAVDEEMVLAVCDALDQYSPTHMWAGSIQVDARAGTVVLSGVVRSYSSKQVAERIARQVKGVTTVENRLVVDAQVELAVAQALAADPRTRGGFPGILVGVVFGVNYLKGSVASAEMKAAAEEIARKIPGVKSVSNELQVRETPQTAVGKQPAAAPAAA